MQMCVCSEHLNLFDYVTLQESFAWKLKVWHTWQQLVRHMLHSITSHCVCVFVDVCFNTCVVLEAPWKPGDSPFRKIKSPDPWTPCRNYLGVKIWQKQPQLCCSLRLNIVQRLYLVYWTHLCLLERNISVLLIIIYFPVSSIWCTSESLGTLNIPWVVTQQQQAASPSAAILNELL